MIRNGHQPLDINLRDQVAASKIEAIGKFPALDPLPDGCILLHSKDDRHLFDGEISAAEMTGRKVLAGLAKGREVARKQAQERSAKWAAIVAALANDDQSKGHPRRGVAGRLARKLGGDLSERQVKRILDALFETSNSRG